MKGANAHWVAPSGVRCCAGYEKKGYFLMEVSLQMGGGPETQLGGRRFLFIAL